MQRKVHDELDSVIGSERLITVDDKHSLPYLNAVIAVSPSSPCHEKGSDATVTWIFNFICLFKNIYNKKIKKIEAQKRTLFFCFWNYYCVFHVL